MHETNACRRGNVAGYRDGGCAHEPPPGASQACIVQQERSSTFLVHHRRSYPSQRPQPPVVSHACTPAQQQHMHGCVLLAVEFKFKTESTATQRESAWHALRGG
jgi:hypothetical protein